MSWTIKRLLVLLALVLIPATAGAHLSAGEDVVKENILIDFGYDPKELRVNESATILFNVVEEKSKKPITFDYGWVRIAADNTVLFSGNLAPAIPGNATMQFIPYQSGKIDITARFIENEKTIVEHTFLVYVVGQHSEVQNKRGIIASLAIVLLVAAYFTRMARKGSKK